MKKVTLLAFVCVMCIAVVAVDAQPKKIALVGRISWCPGSEGSTTDRDFDVMYHFSMDDEVLRYKATNWGYFPLLMPDYVVQAMLSEGGYCPFPAGDDADYSGYINDGAYMEQPDFFVDQGYDLVWTTGTCWSSIGPQLRNVPVPVIQGEHANIGERDKIGSMGIFGGEASNDVNGLDTIILTEAGKTHALTAGLPDEIVIYGEGPSGPFEGVGDTGIGNDLAYAAEGTIVLAVWKDNPDYSALAVMEAGGKYADDTPAPARRVVPFFGGGHVRPSDDADPASWAPVLEFLTPDGEAVLRRCVQWAMGETPTNVQKWANQ